MKELWETITRPESYARLDEPFAILVIALAALAIFFMLLALIAIRRQPKSIPAFATATGRVLVTRSAILELVQTACEQLPGVRKPRLKLRVRRGRTHIDVRLKLESGGRLADVSATLQDHLTRALRDDLGIEKLGDINILVTGFKSGRVASIVPPPAAAAKPEAEAEEPAAPEAAATAETEPADSAGGIQEEGPDGGRRPV